MTRYARLHAPGVVHHVIGRFVNRAFRLNNAQARLEYLRRLGKVVAGTDWRVLGYALMSSHVHLVLLAGRDPSARLIHPLHTGFALWLNRRDAALGPAFAERHTTVLVDADQSARLLAYVHNNPVRAGLCSWAGDLAWTSHRAYVGLDAPPPFLDVETGLALAGFSTKPRDSFDRFVRERASEPRDPLLSDEPRRERVAARREAGAPLEVTSPRVHEARREVTLLSASLELRPRYPGEPAEVARVAARVACANDDIATPPRGRARDAVRWRRLTLLAWVAHLGRGQGEMARWLGVSEAAASQLMRKSPEALGALGSEAELVAAICWEGETGRKAQ